MHAITVGKVPMLSIWVSRQEINQADPMRACSEQAMQERRFPLRMTSRSER